MKSEFLRIIPVLPSQDIKRDILWHKKYTGFELVFGDKMYAGLKREQLYIHLQWHADTKEDPLLGGSVIRIFVKNIKLIFKEFIERGIVKEDKLHLNTPWGTHEFGFYDLNNNAIFLVEDANS
ncbi:glyoxalase/bleomycin resistance/extradiol dioxygenase family protein [uncultured Croceitalea sp.]|uniref:glyoxalase/bleomycin resistance/extradiol dioxygenase family protein n=1 Tax=uncultured Croceitalea sp. TaxID=1798908 RepID=UPI00374EEA32